MSCFDADNRKQVQNIGQLKAIVGDDGLRWRDGYEHARDADAENSICLCGVDVVTTLLDADMMVWRGDGVPEYNFRRAAD